MFRPNTKCKLSRRSKARTVFGKTVFLPAVPVPCSIVKLALSADISSVRADSSASRGAAEQQEAAAVFLFPPTVEVSINDVIKFGVFEIRITKIIPRLNVAGKHDHTQVEGVMKEQDA